MKYALIISNVGTYMKITGTAIFNDEDTIDENLYKEVDDGLYVDIRELLKTHELTYEKDIDVLDEKTLIMKEYDVLAITKSRAKTEALKMLKTRLDDTTMFDFYEFSILNNAFVEKGFIITNANREEKYLEIINTGDTKLIDNLEKYLLSRDRVSQHNRWYTRYRIFEDEMNSARTTSEVANALEKYLNLFE